MRVSDVICMNDSCASSELNAVFLLVSITRFLRPKRLAVTRSSTAGTIQGTSAEIACRDRCLDLPAALQRTTLVHSLMGLSCDCIAMMQAAQSRQRDNLVPA